MIKRLIVMISLLLSPLLLIPAPVSAVDVFENDSVCQDKNGANQSAVCSDKKDRGNPLTGPEGILTRIISLLAIIVGIVALIMIILGGLKFITAGNNPQEVQNARERVIYALIALAIAGLAQAMVQFVLSKL